MTKAARFAPFTPLRGVKRTNLAILGAGLVALYVALPFRVSDYTLSVLNLAGIAAIGASGLNLLTGYCGQLSLGHAAFLGTGAYACAALHLPFPLAAAAAAAIGAVLGLLVTPFAIRLRTHTLAIVTLALVFIGQHVFREWTSVTGGNAGRSDVRGPSLPGTPDQGWFWLVWPLVAGAVLLTAAVARSRLGREMAAVRADERAAAVIGVDVARTKAAAFALSGALAAVAGALYGAYKGYVGPEDWGLLVSIQYLAMVLIGGIGTVRGPVLGALFVTALPRLVEEVVHTGRAAQVTQIVFGLSIIAFVHVTARRRRRSTPSCANQPLL